MTKIKLTLGLLFLSTITVVAQTKNYKIIYKHCIQIDTSKVLRDTIGAEAILIGNNKESKYNFFKKPINTINTTNEKQVKIEDLITNKVESSGKIKMGILYDSAGNMVFHNKTNDSIFVREKMTNEYVITQEKAPQINWIITEESRMIKNYKCMKATTHFRGRDYTAWFTTDIPIIDAPWKFYGLPGLVMDIYDAKNQVKIYVESIEYPTTTAVSAFYPQGTKISLDDYFGFKNNEYKKHLKSVETMISSQEGFDKTGLDPTVKTSSALYCIEKSRD